MSAGCLGGPAEPKLESCVLTMGVDLSLEGGPALLGVPDHDGSSFSIGHAHRSEQVAVGQNEI